MPVTSPDSIYFSDTTTTMDPNAISAAQATSVQAAFALRQRYEFVWANAAARTAQTGMVTGATGYQVDTRTEYIYESATWRLKTPHAEFTSSVSVTVGSVLLIGLLTLDASQSTSNIFVTPGTGGQLIIADPGVYGVSTVSSSVQTSSPTSVNAVSGRAFLDLSKVAGAADQQRVSINSGEDRGSLSKPNLRTTSANQSIYFQFYIAALASGAGTLTTRVSITRIG